MLIEAVACLGDQISVEAPLDDADLACCRHENSFPPKVEGNFSPARNVNFIASQFVQVRVLRNVQRVRVGPHQTRAISFLQAGFSEDLILYHFGKAVERVVKPNLDLMAQCHLRTICFHPSFSPDPMPRDNQTLR